MTHLKPGDNAPDFSSGEIALQSLKRKKIILYFYPKDNTPGCTAEACNLRDNYDELKAMGFEIIGVSPDSEKSHDNFSKKHNLTFRLIADPEKEILKAYGVWGEKKMYGRTYQGVHRTTFIIDEQGVIQKVIKKVKTKDHARQILDELEK